MKKPVVKNPKVLISHVYSAANNGDAALVAGAISEMQRVFTEPRLTAATLDNVQPGASFRGVPLESSLMYFALNTFHLKPVKFFYSLYIIALTVFMVGVWRLTGVLLLPRRLKRATRHITTADLMVPVGGGYVRGKPGVASFTELLLLLHPIVLAKLAGVPVMHHSQSVGPFGSKVQQWLAAQVLRRADLIVARENVTVGFLERMGIPKGKIFRSVDVGFIFESQQQLSVRKVLNIPANKTVVGVTVRKWLKADAQKRYEQAVAELCDHIVGTGAIVVFIPQVTAEYHGDDDRVASRDVAGLMKHKDNVHVLGEAYNADQVKSLYSSLDLVVGTRFHSVIFSLTAQVPAIAIEYEHKTGGIMADLGLSDWVRDINTVTARELIPLYDKLAQQAPVYKKKLKAELPAYIQKAHDAANEIAVRYKKLAD